MSRFVIVDVIIHNCLLASDKKILVFKEIFSFPVIFCNWVFSLRSWGTALFSWVWAKRCVFAGINTGRWGWYSAEKAQDRSVLGIFSNGERGEHDGCAFQHERPVRACIISCHVQRRTCWKDMVDFGGCGSVIDRSS